MVYTAANDPCSSSTAASGNPAGTMSHAMPPATGPKMMISAGSHTRYDSGGRIRQTMTWIASDTIKSASPSIIRSHTVVDMHWTGPARCPTALPALPDPLDPADLLRQLQRLHRLDVVVTDVGHRV